MNTIASVSTEGSQQELAPKDPSQTTLVPEASKRIPSNASESFPHKTGYFDFSMTGKLLINGEKRLELLQGLITNDTSKLLPGQLTSGFMLDKFGKVQTPITILEFKQHALLFLPFLQTEKIQAKLTQDAKLLGCTIENITFDYALLNVAGKQAKQALEKTLGVIEPNAFTLHSLHSIVFQHKGGVDKAKEQSTLEHFNNTKTTPLPGFAKIKAGFDFAIIKQSRLKSLQNYDLLIPKDGMEKVMTKLKQNDIIKQDALLFDVQRIKDKIPEWQLDYSEKNNPLELNSYADDLISETKGCYVGQEIIARLMHRANKQTPQKLIKLLIEDFSKSAASKLKNTWQFEHLDVFYQQDDETQKIGKITSLAYDKQRQKMHLLAMVKKPFYDSLTNTSAKEETVLIGQKDKTKTRAQVN